VRELRKDSFIESMDLRITPACAGITNQRFTPFQVSQDHPRVCGNYTTACKWDSVIPGSPPRVRELLAMSSDSLPSWRITPACAGITRRLFPTGQGAQDHPRVCGNYPSNPLQTVEVRGSPPRVRELPARRLRLPAVSWDHPRVCGNYPKDRFSLS